MKYSVTENCNSEVLRLLREYKVNTVKIQLYDIEVEGIKEVLESGPFLSIEDENSCIEGMSLQAQKLDDMPVHQNNIFRSSTERAALDYVKEMYYMTDVKQLKAKINDIKSRTYRLKIEVRQVDAMLGVLSKEQRFIIEQLYIEGYRWPEVMDQFELTFNTSYSTNTFYAWRDKALSLMENVFQKCG